MLGTSREVPLRRVVLILGCLITLLMLAPAASAGGGPETVLLVVNEDSPLSKHVANYYVMVRNIPPTHVCRLRGIPNLTVITLAQYRERILEPILKFIEDKGLQEEIDIVAFSADFPFGVDYRKDIDTQAAKWKNPPYKFHVASITSLTYLHRKLKDHAYLSLNANTYARNDNLDPRKAHGFRNHYVWGKDQTPKMAEGDETDRYLLSVMLGTTGIQGNTTEEVLECIRNGFMSDGSAPRGSVYLMENKNVRATTRMPMFDAVISQLAGLLPTGVRLKQGEEGQDGKLPIEKDDIIGIVAGTAGFSWAKTKSKMLPGAIAEHLTSFGAKLDGSGQTKITEFIRNGATGTSGTVAEPFAIPHKFPLPFMHGYYAEGCCLAEAFYQSIMGPYQLLVVGEPLAEPYAKRGTVLLSEPDGRGTLSGTVTVKVDASMPEGVDAGAFELWVNGHLIGTANPDEGIELDTTALDDGRYVMRAVIVEDTMVETRSSVMMGMTIKNGDRDPDVVIKSPEQRPVALDDEVLIRGKAKGAREVEILHHGEVVGTAKVRGSNFRLLLPASTFGMGSSLIYARAIYRKGPAVRSEEGLVIVEAPKPLKPAKPKKLSRKEKKALEALPKPSKAGQGLWCVATTEDGKHHGFAVPILGKRGGANMIKTLRNKVKGPIASMRLTGEIEIKTPGLYRFAMNAEGKLRVSVLGNTVLENEKCAWDRQVYAAVPLDEGWHEIEIEYEPTGTGELWLMSGGPVVSAFLEGKAMRHE